MNAIGLRPDQCGVIYTMSDNTSPVRPCTTLEMISICRRAQPCECILTPLFNRTFTILVLPKYTWWESEPDASRTIRNVWLVFTTRLERAVFAAKLAHDKLRFPEVRFPKTYPKQS